ncbi:hypothetical protein H5410_036618 [Solanum commersonii]|uniref:Uncharacterized protein n=1 Tax=Solanum commersonii TaxID=4109 RepID=A0A9J5Y5T6_SOLCO|nr:hypothetical protein H5410_036618 [Solanum commersonii]
MTDKDEFNVAAKIMIPIVYPHPQGSQNIKDIQNDEKNDSHGIRTRDLEERITSSGRVGKVVLALAHGRAPPAYPTAIRTVPNLPTCDLTSLHPPVPPVYVVGDPTLTMPAMINVPYEQFAESVNMRGFIDEGVKAVKIHSMVALQVSSRVIRLSSIGGMKNKREDISDISYQHGEPFH